MFARVTTGIGSPDRIDETARVYREQMVPTMQQQPGFLYAVFLANRESGKGVSVTVWESEEAARASEAQAQQMRTQATQTMNIQQAPTIELYELAVAEGEAEGQFTRVTRVEGRPGQLEAGIRTYQEQTLPVLRQQPGFARAYLAVDRQSGKAISFSVWESEEAMRRSEQAIAQQRTQIAEQVGAPVPTVEHYEVVVQS